MSEREPDIVERLCRPVKWRTIDGVDVGYVEGEVWEDLIKEAAEEIKRLRSELEDALDNAGMSGRNQRMSRPR